jgi:hypothetical protein
VCRNLVAQGMSKENKTRRLGPTFRQTIDANIRLQELETSLGKAATITECFNTIYTSSSQFGFSGVRMCVNEAVFEHFEDLPAGTLWQLRIPLNSSQYINFFRDCASVMDPMILNAFVSAVERGLQVCPALLWHSTKPSTHSRAKSKTKASVVEISERVAAVS